MFVFSFSCVIMLYKLFNYLPNAVKRLVERPFLISGAIVDPKWYWFFKLMLENAGVPKKYQYMFLPEKKWEILVDCWANVWLIADIARFMDMEVYAFEPNPQALNLLSKKYLSDDLVHVIPKAVSNDEWKVDFYYNECVLFDLWATIDREMAESENLVNKISVDVVRLSSYLKKEIISRHWKIRLLKLDVEWVEFDIINDIINEWLYKDIKYIVVETHERFFKNWNEMLRNLKDKITKEGIDNIYLDWV